MHFIRYCSRWGWEFYRARSCDYSSLENRRDRQRQSPWAAKLVAEGRLLQRPPPYDVRHGTPWLITERRASLPTSCRWQHQQQRQPPVFTCTKFVRADCLCLPLPDTTRRDKTNQIVLVRSIGRSEMFAPVRRFVVGPSSQGLAPGPSDRQIKVRYVGSSTLNVNLFVIACRRRDVSLAREHFAPMLHRNVMLPRILWGLLAALCSHSPRVQLPFLERRAKLSLDSSLTMSCTGYQYPNRHIRWTTVSQIKDLTFIFYR